MQKLELRSDVWESKEEAIETIKRIAKRNEGYYGYKTYIAFLEHKVIDGEVKHQAVCIMIKE